MSFFVLRLPPDIRLDWETYNIDVDERPPVGEPRDAPPPQPADDGEAASMLVESLQGAPEGDADPGTEETDASSPDVIVKTDKL